VLRPGLLHCPVSGSDRPILVFSPLRLQLGQALRHQAAQHRAQTPILLSRQLLDPRAVPVGLPNLSMICQTLSQAYQAGVGEAGAGATDGDGDGLGADSGV
jgi:hypothetical protein